MTTTKVYGISNFPKITNGCRLFADCFSCPFSDCLIGQGVSKKKMKAKEEAEQLAQRGLSPAVIAKQLGKSRRTIYRYLKTQDNLT